MKLAIYETYVRACVCMRNKIMVLVWDMRSTGVIFKAQHDPPIKICISVDFDSDVRGLVMGMASCNAGRIYTY